MQQKQNLVKQDQNLNSKFTYSILTVFFFLIYIYIYNKKSVEIQYILKTIELLKHSNNVQLVHIVIK